jgi:hypothetical protein
VKPHKEQALRQFAHFPGECLKPEARLRSETPDAHDSYTSIALAISLKIVRSHCFRLIHPQVTR